MRSPRFTKFPSRGRRDGFARSMTLAWVLLCCTVVSGCSTPRATCWGTCDKDEDCGSGLSCDPTIGYCVQEKGHPDNVQACELEVAEIWVCADHDVQIPLTNQSGDENIETQSVMVRGAPEGVSVVGNQLEGSFEEGEHQVAWGNAPGRHLLTIRATTDCPSLVAASAPSSCLGRDLNATLQATGGKGEVTWGLVGESKGLTLDAQGKLRGSVQGTTEVTVVMVDERNVRVEAPLKIEALAGCASIDTESLPAGCAASVFEWQLDVSGTNIVFRKPTVYSDDPERDLEKLRLEINNPEREVYRLRATPRSDAVGTYELGLIADSDNANDDVKLPFEVRSCAKESRVVCCGDEVTVQLGPGTWGLTSPDNNPMRTNVAIVGDNQLNFARNGLANGSYTLNLDNPRGEPESLLVLLSGPGEEGCEAADAGNGETNGIDVDAASTTDDGGVAPVALPRLPDGCVGNPYDTVYDWGSTLVTAPTVSPDVGLTARASGSSVIISGTPTTSIPESRLTLTADGQTRELQVILRSDCGFVYTAYSAEGGNKLYVGSLASGQPTVQELGDFVPPTHEVSGFRVSPSGQRLLVWTRSVALQATDELFVVDPSSQEDFGHVTLSSELVVIRDAAWSPNGSQFSVIYDSLSSDGGIAERYFSVVSDFSTDPPELQNKPLPGAISPIWPNESAACVVNADGLSDAPQGMEGTTCLPRGANAFVQSSMPRDESLHARTFAGGVLSVSPNSLDIRYWHPGESNIVHFAHVAAPNAQYVGTHYPESVLQISLSSDDTFALSDDTSTGGSVGTVPDCDEVVAWSYDGKRLACTSDTELLLVKIDGSQLTIGRVPDTQDHDLVRRKIFTSDDRYYVFTHHQGSIGYVDMLSDPTSWHVQWIDLGTSSPPDFASLEPVGNDSTIIVHHASLDVIELPHGQNPTPRQTKLSRSAPPAESVGCVPQFQIVGYTNWCGGDDVHDRFLPSRDGLSLLYVSAQGQLVFTDTIDGNMFTELKGGLTLCDPDINTCDTFAFGIK